MVTYFNKKDMVSFTNFVLHLIQTGKKKPDPSGDYEVTHADFSNWIESQKKSK